MSFVALPFAVFGLSGAPPPPVHLLHASAPAHAKKVVFHPARTAVTHAAASTAAKHSATHAAGPAPQPVSRTPMPTPGAATVPAPPAPGAGPSPAPSTPPGQPAPPNAPSPAPVTDPSPPAATPEPAPSGPGRWFAGDGPLNTPIPAGAAVDPSSGSMVQSIVGAAQTHGFSVAVKDWSVPVYYADSTTPRQNVALTASWRAADTLFGVPVPADARPDPEADAQLAVIDPSTNCFYEFYGASRAPDGSLQAAWANRGQLTDSGVQPGGLSTRASGFVNFAGLIRPGDLQAGVIDHALVFAYPYTKAGGPVLPATKSDGRADTEGARPVGTLAIPEGARLQLDPSLDLDSLGLTPWQKLVARALQVYGMYLADTGGAVTLYAQNPQSYPTNPYIPFWGDGDYAPLPTSLLTKLRVLQLGPQYQPQTAVAPSPCGVLG